MKKLPYKTRLYVAVLLLLLVAPKINQKRKMYFCVFCIKNHNQTYFIFLFFYEVMSRKSFNEFSYAEEAYLNDLVGFEAATPPINWKNIAKNLNSRYKGNKTAKECQTYYRNRLQPGHLKTKLSKEDEDILLWAAHEERSDGKIRWTEIAKFFPNRYFFKPSFH